MTDQGAAYLLNAITNIIILILLFREDKNDRNR